MIIGVSETIKNKAKEQRGSFFGMLLCTLGTSLLENILAAGKGVIGVDEGVIKVGERTNGVGHGFSCCLIL